MKLNSCKNTYYSSDTHYNHQNTIKALSSWDSDGFREFASVKHMNETLIANFNEVVGIKDELFLLGDVAFGESALFEFIKQLKYKNIHLILGNHDKRIRKHPNNYSSLFKSINTDLELKFNDFDKRIFLSHYAHVVWPNSHHLAWHLFGHSHNNLPENRISKNSFDCGVDTNNYYPYSFDDIKNKMYKLYGNE